MANGKLFALSGMEGTGKSTICKMLTDKLENAYSVQDPFGYFREFLCSNKYDPDPVTEALCFLTSRSYTFNKKVLPMLEDGKTVIADRWMAETQVYQTYAKQSISTELLDSINAEIGNESIVPDITFILLAEPRTSLKRSNVKLSGLNVDEGRFEQYGEEFHTKIRSGFIKYGMSRNDTCTIDTEHRSIEATFDKIFNIISNMVNYTNI